MSNWKHKNNHPNNNNNWDNNRRKNSDDNNWNSLLTSNTNFSRWIQENGTPMGYGMYQVFKIDNYTVVQNGYYNQLCADSWDMKELREKEEKEKLEKENEEKEAKREKHFQQNMM